MNDLSAPVAAAPANADPDAYDELPLPYIEMDARGIITRANRATMTLHPLEHGALVGKMAWDLMATDEKEQSCAAYMSLMESGDEPPPILRSLYTRHGEFRTYELHRNLIRDAEGQPTGMRMVCVDVTQAKRGLEAAQRARAWMEGVMESVADAVIVTDALGLIRAVNPAAEALVGWKAQELIGKVIENALPLVHNSSESGSQLNFTLALEGHCKGSATILDRERRELRVEITSSPIVDKASGFTTGVVSVARRVADQ
ncbi:MAG TPA: PAS domain-containing protein [Terracidiphilus sp.]|nr:PAS domain-containing protein [Terracidiphilus sp.]